MESVNNINLILHAHLPYVRHLEYPRFLEEDWFFESLNESYIPLLRMLAKLSKEKIAFAQMQLDLDEMKAEKERTSLSLGSSSDSSVLQAELKVIQDEITLITERIQLSQHIYTLMYLTAIDSPHPAIITDGMAE